MASSETDICNLALAHLGEAPILSLDDDSAAGRACRLHYAQVRDEVLRSHRWNFAKRRIVLSALADAPAFGWSYQYELPSLCLRVVEFNDTEIGDVLSDMFEIEGRALLTDSNVARLVYIERVADVSVYDPLCVDAMALKLAVKLSETIRGTTNKTAELTLAYQNAIAPLARRVDANEGRRRKGILSLNSMGIRARGGGYAEGTANSSNTSSSSSLTGAQIVALIDAELGSTDWQTAGAGGDGSLDSPNGHTWVPTIANDGSITWTDSDA